MRIPKMILFDYGQTLVSEAAFDGEKGTEAVLKYAVKNKYQLSAAKVQKEADRINRELGKSDPAKRHLHQVEVPNHMFTSYLYESLGIQLSLTPEKIDQVFWNAASPGIPTRGIEELLEYLHQRGIRTAVLSNISYAGSVVEKRINDMIPGNHFEFIIATSEYLYRKPNRRIFELALEKAELRPENVWYVGDQYECDVTGARNAGLFPLWYLGAAETPPKGTECAVKIQEWTELKELLETEFQQKNP